METTIQKELNMMSDDGYREFLSRIIPTIDKSLILGVRTPVVRKYAKNLQEYDNFLMNLPHKYYEENNLHAFLIEKESDFGKCIEKIELFLPHIDNWATCDSMKPRVLKREPDRLMNYIRKWIKSTHVYTVRYAINLLMSLYLDENFSPNHLKIVADINSKEYYVNMMRAWYFATALAKKYEAAIPYIKNNILDTWTHNKTIQKAIESFRISKEKKELLRTLKILS